MVPVVISTTSGFAKQRISSHTSCLDKKSYYFYLISINGKAIREAISTERVMDSFFIKQLVIKSAENKLTILSSIQSFETKLERKKHCIN